MKQIKSLNNKAMLLSGVAMWVVAIVVRVILVLCGTNVAGQDVIIDALYAIDGTLATVLVFAAVGVLFPVIEEFLFRYWARCSKRAVRITLFAAMGCYIALCTFWWLGVVAFATAVLIEFIPSIKPTTQTTLQVLATTLFFALAHITGFSHFDIDSVLVLIELLGLGLVASWLVINTSFWVACSLHVINNCIALVIIMLSPAQAPYTATEVHFDTPLYSATLTPSTTEAIDLQQVNDSVLVVKGTLPTIAKQLTKQFNPSIITGMYSATEFYKIAPSSVYKTMHQWVYTLTFHQAIPYHNAPQVVAQLAEHSQLQIDTTYEYMYVIGISDDAKLSAASASGSNTLAQLAEDIRTAYRYPAVLEGGINAFCPVDYILKPYPANFDTLCATLADMGLYIYKSDVHKIQTITFAYR